MVTLYNVYSFHVGDFPKKTVAFSVVLDVWKMGLMRLLPLFVAQKLYGFPATHNNTRDTWMKPWWLPGRRWWYTSTWYSWLSAGLYRVTHQVVSNLLLTSKQKLHFSIRSMYWNATFVLMSTGGLEQPDGSPCIVNGRKSGQSSVNHGSWLDQWIFDKSHLNWLWIFFIIHDCTAILKCITVSPSPERTNCLQSDSALELFPAFSFLPIQ